MTIELEEYWPEAGSRGVKITLTDTEGVNLDSSAVESITYTWSDPSGNVINGIEDIAVVAANPFVVPLLPGDTIILPSMRGKIVYRYLTVTVVYTDQNLGTGTVEPIEIRVPVENLVNK